MFKNKYLKQLQDVQARIKTCKASIKKLNPPSPNSFKIGWELYSWLSALALDCKPDVSAVIEMRPTRFKGETYDYLRELGEYFINIADYYQSKKRYEAELEQLQLEERSLKAKLGIE